MGAAAQMRSRGPLRDGVVTLRPLAEIPQEELLLVGGAARSIGFDEVAGDALQLRIDRDSRQWIAQTSVGQLLVQVERKSSDDDVRGVFHLSERICRFADSFGDGAVTLATNSDRTVIAHAGGADASIDLAPWPGQELRPWQLTPVATAVVSMQRFHMLLLAACSVPLGVNDRSYPQPPVWLQLQDRTITLRVDWNDFLPSQATYRLRSISHQGSATVAIPHSQIESVLRLAPEEGRFEEERTLTLTVGTAAVDAGTRDAISLSVDGWELLFWLTDPLKERWASTIDALFAGDGIQVDGSDGVEWRLSGDHDVRVRLHHGHPDVARVTCVLLPSAEESLDLFRELGQLNAASNHIRYWLEGGAVRSAVDVQCTELGRLPGIVRQLSATATRYAPMLAPLGGDGVTLD